ncbi:Ca2+-binding RTX toxin-like protein [Rhizobium sp. BK196]|uniref:calcium-binding protein n=1 Tax=Rhizobium sp. BK196 TaxID=2587073 RepID=UPI001616E985|nr:calcium-binding protein [Rhizobium sp. BK196]MBB3308623.1 Ca2+-binding RTX toxin-like protein [Rhizobium sp. BK196]
MGTIVFTQTGDESFGQFIDETTFTGGSTDTSLAIGSFDTSLGLTLGSGDWRLYFWGDIGMNQAFFDGQSSDTPLNAYGLIADQLSIYGGNGNNHIEVANAETTNILTGAGNDYIKISWGMSAFINPGAGADTMIGAGESDTYFVDNVGDQVIELGGKFGLHDSVRTTLLTYTLGADIEELWLYEGDASGYGNELDNWIYGSDGNNTLNGFAGNNYLSGWDGDDKFLVTSDHSRNSIFGGTGDDTLVYKQGLGGGEDPWAFDHGQSAYFDGQDGADNAALDFSLAQTVTATVNGNAVVYDILGADGYHSTVSLTSVERVTITGSAAADTFYGASGNDWIDGRGGADTIHGSAGDDGYVFDNAGDRVVDEVAGGGTDTIWATVSVDLNNNAYVENLRMNGSANINGIGNGLANTITGNAGNNVIAGGAGNDSLYGKGGVDTFHFNEMGAANKDSIWDFDANDKISLGSAFTGLDLDNNGVVDAASFEIVNKWGAAGTKAGPELIYNAATGVLSYDADGAGTAHAAQDIAFIGAHKAFFDNADILVNSSLLV